MEHSKRVDILGNEHQPLVTIITPSYNQGVFIEDTIRSVLGQTYKNIEYIILDSCSTDETDAVVSKYLQEVSIRYIREKDRGQSHAINKGLELARGEFVAWLNSDDTYFSPHVIASVISIFVENSGVDVISGDGYAMESSGKLLRPIAMDFPSHFSYRNLQHYDFILQPSTFWRRNSVRLDETMNYAFDWKFFIDLYREGFSFLYVREYFSCYRFHDGSKTVGDSAARKLELCKMLHYNHSWWAQRAWGRAVYLAYLLSEKTGLAWPRKVAAGVNQLIKNITGYRIHSC